MYYLLKVLISAVIIATASEIAKRNSVIAALITSLPLTSLLVFIWMKLDGASPDQIAGLSIQIAGFVVASLILFIALWALIRIHCPFWLSLRLSCGTASILYLACMSLLRKYGAAD